MLYNYGMDFKNPLAETFVLNAGLVALMAVQGDDSTPAEIARTSFRNNFKETTIQADAGLSDYLMRHAHATPYEFPDATFYMVMPIFVARQMVRHRTASINEESLRYVEPRPEFWIPSIEECRAQAKSKKQGSSSDLVQDPEVTREMIRLQGEEAHLWYNCLQRQGLANELCRTVLPVGQYTAWYWKASLRNIFGLLDLRAQNTDETNHAQYQIQVYGNAMIEQLRAYFPVLVAFFENYMLNAVTFAEDELIVLRAIMATLTQDQHVELARLVNATGWKESRHTEFAQKLKLTH